MRVVLLLLTSSLLPYLSHCTGETCNILNQLLHNRVIRPEWPKNDVCRYRETPHCCTRSVETFMKEHANQNAHALFFSHLMEMRHSISQQFHSLQKMELPYLSDSFRKKVLEYKLVDNLSKSRDTLLTEATVEYMNIYYNMDHMPNFCKQNLVLNMKLSVNSFLQELVFSHDLVQSNWNVAKDLFAVVFSSQFTPQCVTELIRSGMTKISCKTCTDHTVRIPTCFNYCSEVVTSCLEPYQPLVQLINQWFNLHVQVEKKINEHIHYNRFQKLKDELNILVDKEFEDSHYFDVCRYHFQDRVPTQNNQYNIADTKRKKRLAKTKPPTQVYSTRTITTFYATTVTPHLERFTVAGNQLFDPNMICYNATNTGIATVSTSNCWNGTGRGDYHRSRMPTTESVPTNMFDIHVQRLQSKINDLVVSLNTDLVIVEPETNNVEKVTNVGHGPNFKTATILIIVMTWITLIV